MDPNELNRSLIGTIAILTVVDERLSVVCRVGEGRLRLPTFDPGRGLSLDDVARATVNAVATTGSAYLEQLYTFTAEELGDPGGIVVSYLAIAAAFDRVGDDFRLVSTDDALSELTGVERDVIDYAVVRLRAKIGYTTIAFHLMPVEFTLSELQRTYETILGMPLDKRNFRRRILATGLVSSTDGRRVGANHRPAALYQFAAEHDPSAFLTPMTTGRLLS